jgi:hypothetical protein
MRFFAAIYDTKDLLNDPRPVDPSLSVLNYNAYFPGFEHYTYSDTFAGKTAHIKVGHHLVETADVSDTLEFSTQLHGGYYQCQFTIMNQPGKVMYRFRNYLGDMVVIFDGNGHRVYEGRIITVSLDALGVGFQAAGYYSSAAYTLFEMTYESWGPIINYMPNGDFEDYSLFDGVNPWTAVFNSWGWAYGSGTSRTALATTVLNMTPYITDANGDGYGGFTSAYTASAAKYPFHESTCVGIKQMMADRASLIGGETILYGIFISTVEVDTRDTYSFSIFLRSGIQGLRMIQGLDKVKIVIANEPTYFNDYLIPPPHWHLDTVVADGAIILECDLSSDWVQYKIENFKFDRVSADIETKSISIFVPTCNYVGDDQPVVCADGAMLEKSTSSWRDFVLTEDPGGHYTTSKVILDCASYVPDWNKQLSFVTPTSYEVTEEFKDTKVRDAIERIAIYGLSVSDVRPMYVALWHNRMLHVFPEPALNISVPDWRISVRTSNASVNLSLSILEVFNKIHASTDYRLTPAQDKLSQLMYGVREGIVQNDLAANEDVEEMLKSMAIKRYGNPRSVYSMTISGYIEDAVGNPVLPYRIRAGDQILITDADSASPFSGTISGQATRGFTGFVLKTSYNATNNEMQLDFGSLDLGYEALMGRLGLSGGLV